VALVGTYYRIELALWVELKYCSGPIVGAYLELVLWVELKYCIVGPGRSRYIIVLVLWVIMGRTQVVALVNLNRKELLLWTELK
jgi:hypothetical protein